MPALSSTVCGVYQGEDPHPTVQYPILFHVSPFPNPLIAWLASCIVLVDLVPFGSAFGPQVPPSGGYDEPTGNAAG